MGMIAILPAYVSWHYSEALLSLMKIWVNFTWFIFHFFSISILLQTLFSPFKRLQEEKKSVGFDIGEFAGNFIINSVMRVIGAFLRLSIIAIGLVMIVITFFAGIVAFITWVLMPAVIATLMFFGFSLLIL
jgi:uncharacterized membrane protein YdfJ with MMPL/SSD domain